MLRLAPTGWEYTKTTAALLIATALIFAPPQLTAYSVLSHEELIDISWESDIQPAIKKRFPNATPEQLNEAHAYAYGGSVIQDLGYYPFGNHYFTDLLHYVRTGDFVAWMLRDANSINEFAFALGALSHYASDAWGHPAVNAGVGIEYPKLRAQFGKIVTYEDDPEAHLETEFSFDVVQVAQHRYTGQQYHDFIGFQVSEGLLERAFQDTYGIKVDDLLRWDDLTLETYRFSVSRVIPEMTQVALASRKHKPVNEPHDQARAVFLYHLSRADYEREWGTNYRKPGVFAKIIAFLLKLIPKFGPFKTLKYKDPTAQTEDLYIKSMDAVVHQYHRLVQEVDAGNYHFQNRNLDTGAPTRAGQYWLADRTYSQLVRDLEKRQFVGVTPPLKASLLEFFDSGHVWLKRNKDLRQTEVAVGELKRLDMNRAAAPTPVESRAFGRNAGVASASSAPARGPGATPAP